MAATLTKIKVQVMGRYRVVRFEYQGDVSYTTTGDLLNANKLGLTVIRYLYLAPISTHANRYFPVTVTGVVTRVKAFVSATNVEVAGAANASNAATTPAIAIGW